MVADRVGACLALLLSSIAMVWPATAPAQDEPGVVVDPDSPAGKEYAIPLDEARRESGATIPGGGGGSDDSSGGGAASGALFGAGISPKPGSTARPSGKSGNGSESSPGADRPAGGGSAADTSDDPAPLLLIGGGAALVLLVGTAVALGLRRLGDDGESPYPS
jgi:hypothetical protein